MASLADENNRYDEFDIFGIGAMRLMLGLVMAMLGATSAGLQADTLMLCYSYGCKQSAPVTLSRADRTQLRALFPASRTAEQEREAIAQSVGLFERIVGRVSPIHHDLGGNPLDVARQTGQLDCIAESLNTTALLILLDQQGLLRWHRVVERAYRAPWVLDQHWSAQIEEINSGQRYAVDSWPQNNGEPALIQTLDDWRGKMSPGLQAEGNSSDL